MTTSVVPALRTTEVVTTGHPYAHGLIERLEEWILRQRPDVEVVVVEIEE